MFEETKTGTKLTGFYRGIVKAHSEAGKCKIFWPGVSPSEYETKPEYLPDAEQAAPLFAASKQNDGLFFYPDIDSIVWGFFANGDVNFPVYFASSIGGGSTNTDSIYGAEIMGNKKEAIESKNPSYRTAVLHLGTLQITFNGTNSSIEIKSTMDSTGSSDAFEFGDLGETVSTISFTKDGISIKSNKKISIEGEVIDVKAGNSLFLKSSIDTNILAGGTDENGARLPGSVAINSNKVNIRTMGGGTIIQGNIRTISVP